MRTFLLSSLVLIAIAATAAPVAMAASTGPDAILATSDEVCVVPAIRFDSDYLGFVVCTVNNLL